YIDKLHGKIDALAERFAKGEINRQQFQELFGYYQVEIANLENYLAQNPDSARWKEMVSEGQSILIRKRNATRLLGYSILHNQSGLPIRTFGDFGLDPALFVPMLYAYQNATQEIFGAPMQATQIEGGRWLSFIPGEITTAIVLFTTEPAPQQLTRLRQAQRVFEQANRKTLEKQPVDGDGLIVPMDYFLQRGL
ncbi:MAG TPA: hypothetical protein VN376_08210, partial [Longilinea sp.]|nr:hypothetical protein [Longilinea sp.]